MIPMTATPPLKEFIKHKKIKIWVLAPGQSHGDENLDYYYDFTQSIAEYTKVFQKLCIAWEWKQVTLDNYKETIEGIITEQKVKDNIPLIINLCDGDEVNGAPGISVIHYLDDRKLIYTGSDAHFFHITTSKIDMKRVFDNAGVSNAAWYPINEKEYDPDEIMRVVGTPVIVKPAVSGGSMGVGVKNVVDNAEGLKNQIEEIKRGYRGWDLLSGGLVVEKFIEGREFTVFITGSWDRPDEAKVYPPVERLFHESLPEKQRFLSFDRLWEIYENESPMPMQGDFYKYGSPEPELHETIKEISWKAYAALKGKGYTRIDIRMDGKTGKLYVLEANAQCGLSEDENYTSIGAILRLSDNSFSDAIMEIINDGFERHVGNKKALTI